MNLTAPFVDDSWEGEEDMNYLITLTPKLADYYATLDYDQAGNANVTIIRKIDGVRILDMSLDNGEINQMDKEFFL